MFAVPFVVLVGTSRVYWGVHYPSDVLADRTASLAWVLGLAMLFRRPLRAAFLQSDQARARRPAEPNFRVPRQ